jgi:hypothetical protein
MKTFTVFIREADGTGTTFITSVEAETIEDAKEQALDECSESWGSSGENWDRDDLHVLGVAEGDIRILEWDDQV